MKTIKEFVLETFKNDSLFVENAIKDLENILDDIAKLGLENIEEPMEERVSIEINALLKEYALNNEQEYEDALKELRNLLNKEKLDEADTHFKNDNIRKVHYLYRELLYIFFCEYQHYAVELQSKVCNVTEDDYQVIVGEPEEIILKLYK